MCFRLFVLGQYRIGRQWWLLYGWTRASLRFLLLRIPMARKGEWRHRRVQRIRTSSIVCWRKRPNLDLMYFAGESEPVFDLVLFPDGVGSESELFIIVGKVLSWELIKTYPKCWNRSLRAFWLWLRWRIRVSSEGWIEIRSFLII